MNVLFAAYSNLLVDQSWEKKEKGLIMEVSLPRTWYFVI